MMDRASETLRQNLIHGQGVGSLRETSVIAVASMAKMFVGDLIEKGARYFPTVRRVCHSRVFVASKVRDERDVWRTPELLSKVSRTSLIFRSRPCDT